MAKFYVNRGGGRVPEGPFEELQIVKLILAGKLRAGHVSEVGSQRFFPIASHPPFAAALSEVGVPADPALSAPRALPKAATKSTSRGLLLAAVLSIFGLAIAAVAIGTYVLFSNGGMPITFALPTDTEAVFEVKSVPKLLTELHTLRVVDSSQFLSPNFFDATAQALSDCFGVPKAQTRALILAATSLGIAGRKLGVSPEGGALLSFSNATPVDAFLSSKRFTYSGLVAKSGRRYTLAAGTRPPPANIDHTRRALDGLALDQPSTGIFWFETTKVLFVGSPSFAESVARVLSLDVPSLEQAPKFKAAQQDLSGNANIIGYLDSSSFGTSSDATIQALFAIAKGSGPIGASLEIVPAGLLSHFVAHAATVDAGAGIPAPPVPSAPIAIVDRLPAETFAYVAGVTTVAGSGAELEKRLLDRLAAANNPLAVRVSTLLARAEQRLHVKPTDLLESVGDQAAVAVLARPEYGVTLAEPAQMAADFALVYLQTLKDEAPSRALLKTLQAELGATAGPFLLEPDADGCSISSKDGALRARARILSGTLFIAIGGAPLVERSLRAFSNGEDSLSTDAAERAARGALPSNGRLIAWLDLGRILDATQQNPLLAVHSQRLGFNALHALRWTGPDRVTASLTVTSERRAGADVYHIDALNLPIAIGAYGIAAP